MKFHVYRAADQGWRWRLVSVNGEIVADSGESYSNYASANTAAHMMRMWVANATVIRIPI